MRYRYLINNTEVTPIVEPKAIVYKRSDSSQAFSEDLDSNIVFHSTFGFDFTSQSVCEEIEFEMQQYCNGSWVTKFTGSFEIREGEFDNDKCTFSVKPRKTEFLQTDITVNVLDVKDRVQGSLVTGVKDTFFTPSPVVYADCVWLKDVLLLLAKRGNATITSVVSNFFQINPTGAYPLSTTNHWEHLAITPVSNVQDPIPTNLATIEYITLEELMTDLNIMFDVYWFVEGTTFRVEHSTFFATSPSIDLTDAEYASHMSGTNKYDYDLKELYPEEYFEFIGHLQKTKVVYHGLSRLGSARTEKKYRTGKLYTDYRNVLDNGTFKDGLFLFATDGGVASGGTEVRMLSNRNSMLWPDHLIRNVCTFNRPALYSYIVSAINYWELDATKGHDVQPFTTSGGQIFESVKPVKRQKDISFPLCCTVFDGKEKITTQLGDGVVESATFSTQTGMMKVDLNHETDVCPVRTPIEIGDCALWLKFNTGITTDVSTGSTRVAQWNDQSGNARHATQSTPANMPVVALDNSVNFNDNMLHVTTIAAPPDLTWLTTPVFQLFPSKRGTIFLMMQRGHISFNDIACLSTQNGGASTYFDQTLSLVAEYESKAFAKTYPRNGVARTASGNPEGLFVIRRTADDKLFCRHNSINCFNNPMIISTAQQTSLPLIIGHNLTVTGINAFGTWNLAELIIFDRDLSDEEVEEVEIELAKRGVYNSIYP